MDDFRGKKKMEKRKELGKKRDKSDKKKTEIGSILFAREGFSLKGPSKENMQKKKHNSQEDETKLLVPNECPIPQV